LKFLVKILTWLLLLTLGTLVAAWLYFDEEHISLNTQTRSPFNQTYLDLPSGTVHYETGGPPNGEVVVLVHGFSVPSYLWDPTFAALSEAGYRVLRFDLYGRGHSDRPDVDYTLGFFSTQLEQLTDALGLTLPFNLVGLSMGGPIVTLFSNQHPDRVKRLILIDPMVFMPTKEDISPLNLPLIGEYLANVYLIPRLAAGQTDDFQNRYRYPDWEKRFREQMQYHGFRHAILSTVRHLPQADSLDEYRKLGLRNVPVKIFWGRQDQTIPLEHSGKLLEFVPQAKLSIIEDAGHIPHFEQPETFNPLLIEFLQRPPPGVVHRDQ